MFDRAVARRHAQGAAALRGHAGEALPPVEVVHRHTLKVHVATAPHPLGGALLLVGFRYRGEWRGWVNNGRVGKSALGESRVGSHCMFTQFPSTFVVHEKSRIICTQMCLLLGVESVSESEAWVFHSAQSSKDQKVGGLYF